MKKFLLTALAVTLLWACNAQSDEVASKKESEVTKSGIVLDNMDTSVRPQDDFYRYVNGKWLETTTIPDDRSSYSSFTEIHENNQANLRKIIEESSQKGGETGSDAQLVGDFYTAYMDTDTIESLGIKPLQGHLDQIRGIKSHKELPKLLGELEHIGIGFPVAPYVSSDMKDPNNYAVYLSQSGLSLPDRSYYLDDSDKMKENREAFLAHVARMLELAGIDNGKKRAEGILAFETKVADSHWTRVESRNRDKTYNKVAYDAFLSEHTNFDWKAFFAAVGIDNQDLIVRQPSAIKAFDGMFKSVSMDTWKDYLMWHVINGHAGYLSKDFVDESFAFYSTKLSGVKTQRPRWKRGVNATNGSLGMLVGKVFVDKHFRPEAKERMVGLVENLKGAFAERLDSLDWMSAETKVEAHKKLKGFKAKIGYPDKWRTYEGLEIKNNELIGNIMRSRAFEHKRSVSRLGKPVDRDEWFMTPQTVNAYYSSTYNEIVFPAAILMPPFFDLEADMAVNYGGIGAVIGHEITHGFDDQGRKSNGDGVLQDWWKEADAAEFDKRANMVVEQYNAYKPLADMSVNGKLTLGENIADLGGLTMAYYAYKRSLNGKPSPQLDGFTGEQRLFMGWAQIWRQQYRDEAQRRRLATDSHSPGEFRTIGPLKNMPEFFEAFDVKEGDPMRRKSEELIKIW